MPINDQILARGASSERVGTALAGVMGISSVERDGKIVPPIDGRLNRFQMYADQALTLGLNGTDAAQVLREVKASPDGRLLPATRERLIRQQHEERGEAWADSVQHVQALEHTARLVPATISAYGTRAMPPGSPLDEPVRLSPAGGSGAVIFTPSPAPTVIVSPTISTAPPTVIVTPAASTTSMPSADNTLSHTDSALDGMRSEGSTSASQSGSETKSRGEGI